MLSIPNPIQSTAEARPAHVVLVAEGRTLTARGLCEAVRARAAVLSAEGLGVGDRVALLSAPSADWVVNWHALGWLGCVIAPLPHQAPTQELLNRLRHLEPAALITDQPPRDLPVRALPMTSDATPQSEVSERFWPLEEPRAILFTSGTTGAPRPVTLNTAQLIFSAFGSSIRLGHDPQDRWLACLPLYHVGGLSILMRCALMGTCVLLHPRFDAVRVARALDSGQATLVSLVPTMLRRVLEVRPQNPFPETLRTILLGGAAAPESLIEQCRTLRVPVALTWGMSEAASQVTTRFAGDLSPNAGSGPPLAFARVDVRERALVVSGPLVETAELQTPDVGCIDEEGRVHVFGRADDVIVSGGEKLMPGEIEAVLREHPWVKEAAVVGHENPDWGERPVAFVVCDVAAQKVEAVELARSLRGWCRAHLESFKAPDHYVWSEALPRTELGKISRVRLRERIANETPLSLSSKKAPPRFDDQVLGQLETSAVEVGHVSMQQKLSALRAWLQEDLGGVAEKLSELGSRDEHVAQRAAGHLLGCSGKRVRPLCILLAGRLAEGDIDDARAQQLQNIATAAELVHAATLLHDDVIDQGEQRRGAACAHTLYGNTASILAGDHLLVEALALTQANAPEALESLIRTIREMVAAEALQLEQQRRFEPRADVYMQIALGKTASLFRWSLRTGALIGASPRRLIDAADEIGQQVGIAFQLIDDILDIDGEMATTGKAPLNDLREGKMTWPLIKAVERSPSLGEALRAFAMSTPTSDDEAAIVRRITETGALDSTRLQASKHLSAAHRRLREFPESRARCALEAVIDFMVRRAH